MNVIRLHHGNCRNQRPANKLNEHSVLNTTRWAVTFSCCRSCLMVCLIWVINDSSCQISLKSSDKWLTPVCRAERLVQITTVRWPSVPLRSPSHCPITFREFLSVDTKRAASLPWTKHCHTLEPWNASWNAESRLVQIIWTLLQLDQIFSTLSLMKNKERDKKHRQKKED